MAKTVLDELKRRISYMKALSITDAPSHFSGLLNWIESEPPTHSIIARLRLLVDMEALTKDCGPYQPPSVSSPEQVARIGLSILEYCRERPNNLPGLLFGIGCHISHGDFNDHLGLALEKYINPFLAYLQEELRDIPVNVSIDSVAEMRRDSLLSPEFERLFPNTSRLLQNVSKEMAVFVESENWFNVANSCRLTLQEFARELPAVLKPQKPENMKAGDAKGVIGYFLSETMAGGRNSGALKSVIESVWDYVSSLLHKNTASRPEAMRAYLWTCLAISEVFEQIKDATQSKVPTAGR